MTRTKAIAMCVGEHLIDRGLALLDDEAGLDVHAALFPRAERTK